MSKYINFIVNISDEHKEIILFIADKLLRNAIIFTEYARKKKIYYRQLYDGISTIFNKEQCDIINYNNVCYSPNIIKYPKQNTKKILTNNIEYKKMIITI
jgi:hypothetical protein